MFDGPSKRIAIRCPHCGGVENYQTVYRDSNMITQTLAYHECDAMRQARRDWFDTLPTEPLAHQ